MTTHKGNETRTRGIRERNARVKEGREAAEATTHALATSIEKPDAITFSEPEDIFRLYAQFCGDLDRTACATGKSVDEVVELAEAGKWQKKIAVLLRLKDSGVPGDAERGINRAVNFIQADRMRQIVERAIQVLQKMSNEEFVRLCLVESFDHQGNGSTKIVMRAFADLATSLEKCHAMTYQALSDTATDRKDRRETNDESHSAGELHIAMADALAKVRAEKTTKLIDIESVPKP